MFLRIHLKKAFNTKYHEGTKDKKNWNFKTNLTLRTFVAQLIQYRFLNSTVKTANKKQVIWLAQEATTWFKLIPLIIEKLL
jgi:hypothetical protein